MSRARDLSRLTNPVNFTVDSTNNRIGLNSTSPTAKLNVAGIVSATEFYGDGSNLEGVASAGLGTALGETAPLDVIYYTDNVLNVNDTTTITVPTGSDIAYTQYAEVVVANTKDLIVADGDDFVPDVLGLSTEGITNIGGSGGRVRADFFTNHAGTGAPTFQNGINVTAGTASFSGNVSIAGTLTYEDVTNVDSVGIITARNGINVAGGTITGDGSGLTGVAPSFSGIASGSLSNGQTVIITSDGKVTAVSATTAQIPQLGAKTSFEDGSVHSVNLAGVYDPDTQKVIVNFADGGHSGNGKACVGTVNGSTITFGAVAQWHGGNTEDVGIAYDTGNDRVVVCGRDATASNAIYNVGSISGTSLTFGSYGNLSTDGCREVKVSYDTNADRVLFIYKVNTGDAGKCKAGEVSNLSISFGSEATFESGAIAANMNSVTYHPVAQKHVITYAMGSGGSYDGRAKVATIDPSNNSVTFGTHGTFHSSTNVTDTSSVYDSTNQRIVIAFNNAGASADAIVGQVTGTNITFGPKRTFFSDQPTAFSMAYDPTNDKVGIAIRDVNDSSKGKFFLGSVDTSDNSISFGSTTDFNSPSYAISNGLTFDASTNQFVVFYPDGAESNRGTARTINPITVTTNVTDGNFLGFSNAAYTNGQTAKIQVVGAIDDAQTGLTTGAKHYVQKNGSLATTADSPSVEAGTALSATQILIR